MFGLHLVMVRDLLLAECLGITSVCAGMEGWVMVYMVKGVELGPAACKEGTPLTNPNFSQFPNF